VDFDGIVISVSINFESNEYTDLLARFAVLLIVYLLLDLINRLFLPYK
jgi:hypothetical protein